MNYGFVALTLATGLFLILQLVINEDATGFFTFSVPLIQKKVHLKAFTVVLVLLFGVELFSLAEM